MLKRFLPFCAASSWWFTDPDTGQGFQAVDKPDLIKQILAYREQNGLPEIYMLSEVIDNFLCGLPENRGKCGKNEKLQRNLWTTLKGGILLIKNVLIGVTVPQAVADVRSEKCLNCPHNVNPDKGKYDKWADRLAEASVPGKKSKFHNQIANCEVCTCPLRVKVWTYGPFGNTKEQEAQMRKVGCWQIVD